MDTPNQEPKESAPKSIDQSVDAFLDQHEAALNGTQGTGEPDEKSSAQESPDTPDGEGGTDPQKTESTQEDAEGFEGVPGGFAKHPAWQKQQQKLKEAQAELEKAKASSALYSELLADPVVYRKYLEKQGYRPDEIRQIMREQGLEIAETPKAQKPSGPAALIERICEKRGWDMNALSADQKAYISDLVALAEDVAEAKFDEKLGPRIAPLEEHFQSELANRKVNAQMSQAKEYAERYKFDWAKDIEPILVKKLDELDAKDPTGKRLKFDPVEWIRDVMPQLVEERALSTSRQEARNEAKKNLRPLGPGASTPTDKKSLKGRNVSETVDKFLDAAGIR